MDANMNDNVFDIDEEDFVPQFSERRTSKEQNELKTSKSTVDANMDDNVIDIDDEDVFPQISETRTSKGQNEHEMTKSTVTPLVLEVFDTAFANHLKKDQETGSQHANKKRYGVCSECLKPDCGNCGGCRSMIKYGGRGKGKKVTNPCAYE